MKSVLAVLLIALAVTPAVAGEAKPAKPTKPARACFYAQSASNFAVVDDRTVNIRAGVRDIYELKLVGPCLDLSWSHALGLAPRSSATICEGPMAGVDVITRGGGAEPQRCRVSEVRKLTPDQVQALPGKARP